MRGNAKTKHFLDTNIFVYTFDRHDPDKRKRAIRLVEHALEGGRGVVKLRGFTVYLSDGQVSAVHESTDHSYFGMADDGDHQSFT